jgi:peptidyl-prolyl cis-trans isomerase C
MTISRLAQSCATAVLLCAAPVAGFAQDAAAPAATPARAELTPETVVATVNGTNITLGHMIALRASLPEEYQTLEDAVLFNGILDQLIQQAALEQSVAGAISKFDMLKMENERRGYLSGVAISAVVAKAVTDAAITAAYDERMKGMQAQTEYNAAHILVDSEAKAIELKAQIDGGADFAELAIANSSDGAAANGGDLGWFGPGMMVKPFEDAVLKVGEVAGPVKTDFGWHLVKLIETRNAALPTLEELRPELAAEIEQKAIADHVTALTAAATVTRPGEGIDPAVLKDQTILER